MQDQLQTDPLVELLATRMAESGSLDADAFFSEFLLRQTQDRILALVGTAQGASFSLQNQAYKALVVWLAEMGAEQVRSDYVDEPSMLPLTTDELDEYVGYWMDQLKQDVREQIR